MPSNSTFCSMVSDLLKISPSTDAGALQLDAVALDGALEGAIDDQLLHGHVALDFGAFANQQPRGVDIADQPAENLHGTGADQIAGDKHAWAEDGNDFRHGLAADDRRFVPDLGHAADLVALAFRWGKVGQLTLLSLRLRRLPGAVGRFIK
ncbi:MAG: hypothetical protein WDN48_02010 [Pseudolabrys sp.]